MRWLLLLLLVVALQPQAQEGSFRPEWTAACQSDGTDFSIHFTSRSRDPLQDDQSVTLAWGKDKPVALPVAPALFVPGRFLSDARNHCDGIGAFDWPNGTLLLLLARNDRPADDVIVAVVVDAKTGKLVQSVGDIGAMSSGVVLLRRGAGYRILLERSSHVDASDHGEFLAPDWMLLEDARGRLVHAWENPRR